MYYSVTKAMLFLGIHRGKEAMKKRKYHQELGSITDFTKRIMETTEGLGQKNSKGTTKNFLFLIVCLTQRGQLNL